MGAMNLSPSQLRAIHGALSVFETGRAPSARAYATVSVLRDGAGISYGLHQSTDRANSLDAIASRYLALKGLYAEELRPMLGHLASNDSTKLVAGGPYPAWAQLLMRTLSKAGGDPIMQRAQDEIFDELYLKPALREADDAGLTTALGALVMYDTAIQSGEGRIKTHRKAFPEKSPRNGGDEHAWIEAYLRTRGAWLLASSNPLVRASVYRVDSLLSLAKAGLWALPLPLKIRGVTLD